MLIRAGLFALFFCLCVTTASQAQAQTNLPSYCAHLLFPNSPPPECVAPLKTVPFDLYGAAVICDVGHAALRSKGQMDITTLKLSVSVSQKYAMTRDVGGVLTLSVPVFGTKVGASFNPSQTIAVGDNPGMGDTNTPDNLVQSWCSKSGYKGQARGATYAKWLAGFTGIISKFRSGKLLPNPSTEFYSAGYTFGVTNKLSVGFNILFFAVSNASSDAVTQTVTVRIGKTQLGI